MGHFIMEILKMVKKNRNGKLVFKDKIYLKIIWWIMIFCDEGVFIGKMVEFILVIGKIIKWMIMVFLVKKILWKLYNLKEGFGCFFWNDGHKYEGFWKEGK